MRELQSLQTLPYAVKTYGGGDKQTLQASGQLHAPAALHPGNLTPLPFEQEAGWGIELK
jgi:hypothetical protein